MGLGRRSLAVATLAWACACGNEPKSTPPPSGAGDGPSTEPGASVSCASAGFPAAPDSSLVRYVGPCAAPDANAPLGSASRPYPTIVASLEGLAPHTTIVIAPGTYDGALRLTQAGTRLWASSGERAEDARVVVRAAAAPASGALVSIAAADVVVHGLRLEDAANDGIEIRGGSASIRGTTILRPKRYGIDAKDGAIIFQNVAVEGAGTIGIIFQNVSGIIFQNTVRGAGTAGMVARGPKLGDLSIRENHLLGNTSLGLGIYGLAGVVVEGNQVSDTSAHATRGGGDGIVVGNMTTPPLQANVELRKNVVERSARTGIIFQNQPNAIIFQNQVRKSGAGGIRATVDAAVLEKDVVRFEGNIVEENAGYGIAMMHGRAIIFQNQVRTTSLTDFGLAKGSVGDGIALVTTESNQRIEGNEVSGATRVGMLFDGLHTSSVVAKNTMSGNVIDVFLQNSLVTLADLQASMPGTKLPLGGGGSAPPPLYFPSDDNLPAPTDPGQ